MKDFNKYVFIPSFSLEPNKVTSYNSVFVRDSNSNTIKSIHECRSSRPEKFKNVTESNVVSRSSHNFSISDNAYRTLKRRINWLYYLAKSKSVKTYSGKEIFNFKMGFITLTLPSKQLTCTKDVTKNLLNNFLTEIREKTGMENYVWRLEFQKNGNVHYHIVTDTYLDYFFILKTWNRILKLNGYIDAFKAKFQDLTLSQYRDTVDKHHKTPFNLIAKRYAKAKASNWESPPSVDVKSVISNQAISNYIAKYFGKTDGENPIANEFDNSENSSNLRLWFCSRSLSKLKTISNFCEAVVFDIFSIVSYSKKLRKVIGRYATSMYFDISSMRGNPRKWIETILKDYSLRQGYIPAS